MSIRWWVTAVRKGRLSHIQHARRVQGSKLADTDLYMSPFTLQTPLSRLRVTTTRWH